MTRFHARTDVGLKRRHNEDALLALDDVGLFVVADGVGGRNAGELASALTVDTFQARAPGLAELVQAFGAQPCAATRNDVLGALDAAANAASTRVYETAEHTGRQGMTTTLVAAIVGGGAAFVVHVGDSRAYLLRDGELRQLTEDHSLVNELRRNGTYSASQAASNRYRNVITRAVGLYPSVQADVLAIEVLPGDRLLLCSDGLSDMVDAEQVLRLLRAPDVTGATESLVEAALAGGGRDNVSVVVIDPEATLEPTAVAARAAAMERLFLFRDLPSAARLRVGRILSETSVEAGETLMRQGDPGDTLYVVTQGEVEVEIDGQVVATLGAGQHFGELALTDDAPRSATIRATRPTALLTLERDALRAYCTMEPGVGNRVLWRLVESLGQRLRTTNARLTAPPGQA